MFGLTQKISGPVALVRFVFFFENDFSKRLSMVSTTSDLIIFWVVVLTLSALSPNVPLLLRALLFAPQDSVQ